MNSVHTFLLGFPKIHSNIILPSLCLGLYNPMNESHAPFVHCAVTGRPYFFLSVLSGVK